MAAINGNQGEKMYNKYRIAVCSSEDGDILRTSSYEEVMGYQFTEIFTVPDMINNINSEECNLKLFFLIKNGKIVYDSSDDISIAMVDLSTVGNDFDINSYQSVISKSDAVYDSIASFITYLNGVNNEPYWAIPIDKKKKKIIQMKELV